LLIKKQLSRVREFTTNSPDGLSGAYERDFRLTIKEVTFELELLLGSA
jgi:hypothetical protein